MVTDIQGFLDSGNVVVETLFSGLLRLIEAKLNSIQNELSSVSLNEYGQHTSPINSPYNIAVAVGPTHSKQLWLPYA